MLFTPPTSLARGCARRGDDLLRRIDALEVIEVSSAGFGGLRRRIRAGVGGSGRMSQVRNPRRGYVEA